MDIADLALLSDCRTAALADRGGSVVWWSPHRFDGPSVFGRLLDPDAGHWTIRAAGATAVTRRYLGEGPILETTFEAADGALTLTDLLAIAPGATGHRLGGSRTTRLVRIARCTRGRVTVEMELVARPDYGRSIPHLVRSGDGWELVGGPSDLSLSGSHADAHEVRGDRLVATVELDAADGTDATAAWILTAARRDDGTSPDADDRPPQRILDESLAAWDAWATAHETPRGPHAAAMRRSAMVLQALTHAPTGVVVAAPTTSLPERIGQDWNWDYRFAWLRDLAFVVRALYVAACPDEPIRYFDWIARALGRLDGQRVQIMFGVEGERDLTEHTLDHLRGFRDSRPVRIGNDAWSQRQLDVPGEVLDAAFKMRHHLPGELPEPVRRTFVDLAEHAARNWRDPDHGMWESRDEPRHYLSGKVMAWVALDRAVRMAERFGATERVADWTDTRDAVRRAVLTEGWNDDVGAFTGAFGSDRLDASVLLMPLTGIIKASDERMRATIERVEERLASGHGVQRWADEGAGFVICGFWLAECLFLAGERERAEERYAATAAGANDLGLFSEEVALDSGEQLGNSPQALSHVGQINAASTLAGDSDRDPDEHATSKDHAGR